MNHNITKLFSRIALVAFFTVAFASTALADSVTFSYGDYKGQGTSSSGSSYTMAKTDVSITNTKFYGNNNYAHFYAGGVTTITPGTGVTVTGIELTASTTGYNGYQSSGTITASTGSVSGSTSSTTVTWTGSATSAFTISNNKQIRWTSIVVTYSKNGGSTTTYTVYYDANGGTGTMTDPNSPYNSGATVTVLDNSFTRSGYTFSKWNTAANGSGTDYNADDTFSISSNTTLYAQWTQNGGGSSADVTYDFTGSDWSASNGTLTNNSVSFTGYGKDSFKMNSGYFMLGKEGAYINFPTYSQPVSKIVVTGRSGASGSTKMNIFVGDEAVSTETTGSTGTSTYEIASNYQAAGTQYTLKVTSSHNAQITKIEVYYADLTAPSFTASDQAVAYDATNGSFDFTLNNPVTGGVVSVSEDVDWISDASVSGSSVTFTLSPNNSATSREGIVTLTYTYNTNVSVTKNVTVTQAANPNVVPTISEVRTQGSGTATTKGIVTSISGSSNKTAYIQDASAAIVVYGDFTAAVGDEIRVSGTLSTYKGLLEITSPSVTVLSSGNSVTPEVMTIAQVNSSTNQGWLVKIEDATVTAISEQSVTIAQNANTIDVRFNSSEDIDFAVNDVITFVGNIGCFNTVQIANPTDVVVQVNTAPVINASDVEIEYNATSGEIAYTIDNPSSGVSLGATSSADWISNINVASDKVTFTTTANNGDTDRTATFTLTYNGATDKTVTVTQKHFVADYATLPFSFDGGKDSIDNTAGLSQNGLDSDYGTSPKLKFNSTGDWVILKINERPGDLSFSIKGNGFSQGSTSTFKVQTSEDGTNYSDLATYTELGSTQSESFNNLGENVRYIKWIYTEKGSTDGGNVALGNIELASYVSNPTITITPASVNASYAETDATLPIVYTNLTISDMTDFDIQYYDSENNEISEPEWIASAVAEEDPSVGEGYVLSYFIEANSGAARTAYLKVYALDDNTNVVYSNRVTITQDAYVVDYAELPFEFEGGKNDVATTNGLTHNGLGSDYSGVTTKLKFDSDGDWLILQINEAPGMLSFDIKGNSFSGGTFKVQTSADGAYYTDLQTYTSLSDTQNESFSNLGSTVRYIRWIYTEKSNGNVGVGNIKLTKAAPESFERTATLNNGRYWTTFYNSSARYTLSEGAQAFIMDSNKVLYRLGDDGREIPANTAVVIISNTEEITLTKSTSNNAVNTHSIDNILEGSDIAVAKPSVGTTYVLGVVDGVIGFYEYTATDNIPAAKAFYVVL